MDREAFEKDFLEKEKKRMLNAFYDVVEFKFQDCGLTLEEMAKKLYTTTEHLQGLIDGIAEPNIDDILNFSICFDYSPSEMFDQDLLLGMFGFNAVVQYLYTYDESRSEMYEYLIEKIAKFQEKEIKKNVE